MNPRSHSLNHVVWRDDDRHRRDADDQRADEGDDLQELARDRHQNAWPMLK